MLQLLLRIFVKDHENTQDPKVRSACGKMAGIVGIICNLLLFGGKLTVGLLSGSVAISADAVNNLSDASSSLVTLLGFKLSEQPADEEHPFGHARMEYLSGLAVAALILFIGVELAKTSVTRIIHPEPVEFSLIMLLVLAGSIAMKLWMCIFAGKLGKRIHSKTLMATAADSRNDALSTGAVLLSCLVGYFFRVNVDGYMGLLVALFILWSGWGIVKDTISPLLGEKADEELVASIKDLILSHDKILGIHDLMVHDYGPGQCFASVHAEMDVREDPLACHDVLDDIEREALRELKVHLVMHYDPVVTTDEGLNQLRKLLQEIIGTIHPSLSMHDFRMVQGPGHTNLIFDLVVPYELADKTAELKKQIDSRLEQEEGTYYTVITFDSVGQNQF